MTALVRSFTISTLGGRVPPARWCWVRVHPTLQHLRAAAHRTSPWFDHSDTWACFQPAVWREKLVDGEWVRRYSVFAGTLRLLPPAEYEGSYPEVVAHELLHAAAQIYRMNVQEEINLQDDCGSEEENLAYIYGELFNSFYKKCVI